MANSFINKKICFVVSSPMTVSAFLEEPIRQLCEHNQVYIVANLAEGERMPHLNVTLIPAPLVRKISPWQDLRALVKVVRIFARYRFDSVHSVTPKAGLVAMTAGLICRIPIRLHTFTGQVWATRRGVGRFILKNIDRVIAYFATHILVDSFSQRQFLLEERVVPARKAGVLHQGSISGVNLDRFVLSLSARNEVRKNLQLNDQDVVLLFIGRLNRDKGVLDLAAAFSALCQSYPSARLLVVGPDEENMLAEMHHLLCDCLDRVRFVGYTGKPEDYMSAADILCLPSYREGFGSVVIEAAAIGIPTVGSRIYGVVDAILDNETGLLFTPRDVKALERTLGALVGDAALRRSLGEQAQARVRRDFASVRVAQAWLEYYERLAA